MKRLSRNTIIFPQMSQQPTAQIRCSLPLQAKTTLLQAPKHHRKLASTDSNSTESCHYKIAILMNDHKDKPSVEVVPAARELEPVLSNLYQLYIRR